MFGNTDFTLFGVSWILVGTILVALVRRYVFVSEEGVKLGAALFMAIGFFLDKVIVGEQFVFPSTPSTWLHLALGLLIYFGTVMGLAPGDTARRAYNSIKSLVKR